MSDLDGPDRGEVEADAPRAALAAVLHRIGASLDPDAVLREVIEGARALSGVHKAAVCTSSCGSAMSAASSSQVIPTVWLTPRPRRNFGRC